MYMKRLIILRHGKSEQYSMFKDDFDRALTERGRKNSNSMGAFILKKNGMPDLILTSSAKRARETAVLAAKSIGYPEAEIQANQSLYLAPYIWIMNVLSKLPDKINSCIIVGHDPGLTDLVNILGVQLDNLPTASTACFEFNVESWKKISADQSNFKWLKIAREL